MRDGISAGIDVGTNAVKSVIARVSGGRIVEILGQDRRATRLGEGVDESGRLSKAALMRTCHAIAEMVRAAREAGATRIRAGATSAARDAKNGDDLVACVRASCGVTLEILSGAEEGRLTFLAISAGETHGEPLAVIDPGGGSTEWVLGRGTDVTYRHSFPVGAVRATERWLPGDPPAPDAVSRAREEIHRVFADLPDVRSHRLIGTGGTLRNLAAVHARHAGLPWEEARILSRTEVERQIALYTSRTLENRKAIPGLEPDRADIILGGALVVDACLRRAGCDTLQVTDLGLRHGLAVEA